MKVVITGGTGFIGTGLARHIIERGTMTGPSGGQEAVDSIVLFDMAVPGALAPGLDDRVSMQAGDIADRDTVFALVDRDDISVFHFASVVSGGGERDFDLAMRVNLAGGRNILEAVRARASTPRLVFTSSIAVFGGARMPDTVSDTTKQTPQTTYGITKTIGELMINDYTRKGYIDGRAARLPTVIVRPGKPNAAASSFASGIFREPLNGEECVLPVPMATPMPAIGHRNCIRGITTLHEAPGAELGDDRAVNLPGATYTLGDCVAALGSVAARRGIELGAISVHPNPNIEAIVKSWPAFISAERGLALGMPTDESLEQIINDYIDDFLAV